MELQDLLHKLKESQLQGVFDFLSITCPEGKSRYGMLIISTAQHLRKLKMVACLNTWH